VTLIEHSATTTSIDPYKTLGLHPSASRDLIEAAYWALVARLRKDLAQDRSGVESRLHALNESYEILNDPYRRAMYDTARGLDRHQRTPLVSWQRNGLFRGSRPCPAKATYYEVLQVDVTADPTVVELAYQARQRQLRPGDASAAVESSLVERAFRTLNGQSTRSQYDRQIGCVAESPSFPSDATAAPARRRFHSFTLRLRSAGAGVRRDAAVDDGEQSATLAGLVFTVGPFTGQTVALVEGSLIIGSNDIAGLVLPASDGTIGAGHARVWFRGGEYILHQLDTSKTTHVNGERLDLRMVILEAGDEIVIGPHTLRFERAPAAAS